jgi:surfeit locus 1 family protein
MAARGAGPARHWSLAALLAVATVVFISLGVWQLERRIWKLDLIAAVDARVHAPAVAAPGSAAWPQLDAAHDAYRHVAARGVFLGGRQTLVQAVTAKGPGFWVMAPLRADGGFTVLVNRGFVPDAAEAAKAAAPQGETTVTGLLRLTEPQGGFLRRNAPAEGRWYSRDVAAITYAQGLTDAAPYFIDADADADAAPGPGGWPVGGLTVIRFPNSHLAYAATWFALAVMCVGWGAVLLRRPEPAA